MKRLIFALFALAALALPVGAQTLNQNLPANTVVGRLGAGTSGPAQAIPFASLATHLDPLNQGATHTFWNPSAKINRLADRLFVGPAVTNDGNASPFTNLDWLSALGQTDGNYAQLFVLTENTATPATAATPLIGGLFGTQTLKSLTASTPRALETIAYNNVVSGQNPTVWARYSEARQTGTSTGNTYSDELETINTVASVAWDPFATSGAGTIPLELGCGGGGVGTFACTTGMYIAANTQKFNTGILFLSGSIAASGPSSSIPAIALPRTYEILWYASAGVLAGRITSDGSNNLNLTAGAGASVILNNKIFSTIAGGTLTGLGTFALRDTSAAFDVTIGATSSAVLTAGRALTLDVGNVAHTISYGTIANTITFPSAASGTVPFLNLAQTFTATQTLQTILAATTNTYDIGTSAAASAFRTIYAGTSFSGPAGVFTTSVTSPLHIGGSGTTGTQLTLQTTTGNGTTDAIAFKGGNNGATTFATLNSSQLQVTGNLNVSDGAVFGFGAATTYMGGSSASGFVNYVTGSTERMRVTLGVTVAAPTGGDKGAGTLNVQTGYYANGTAGVTCGAGLGGTSRTTLGLVTTC